MLEFILKRKRVILLFALFVFVFGIYSISKLDKELLPVIEFNQTAVIMETEAVPAKDVEQFVTIPVEQAISNIKGVVDYSSTSAIGYSMVMVEVESGETDDVTKEIQATVNGLSSDISLIRNINVMEITTENPYETIYTITGESISEISDFSKNVLEPRLEALPEVRDVLLTGLEEKEVSIELHLNKLEEYGVQLDEVINFLQQMNVNTSVGKLESEDGAPSLRWNTGFTDIDDVRNLNIPTTEGMKSLSEIATVTEEVGADNQNAWKNGDSSFILVQIGRNSNVATQIDAANAVKKEVEKINEEGLIGNVQVEKIVSQADYVEHGISGITDNILIGALIAVLVLLIFLRSVRSTIIISISIPVSILLTFLVLNLLGYSLNLISLVGLGLGIGMLVDASIVVLESIYKKKEQGLQNLEAVIQGTKEVLNAVVASIITTIVVFLPLGILDNQVGEIAFILAIVVSVSLLASMLVSFTVIPALSENLLKVRKKKKNRKGIGDIYGSIVAWIVERKRRSLGVVSLFLVIFIGSLFLIAKIPVSVMPDFFDRYSEVIVELESGVGPEEREEIALALNNKLNNVPDIENSVIIDDVERMLIVINMTPAEEQTIEQKEVSEQILSNFRELEGDYPIISISTSLEGQMGMPVQLVIAGDGVSKLSEIGSNLAEELKEIEGLSTVIIHGENSAEELSILLDEEKIENDGIPVAMIFQQVGLISWEVAIGEMTVDGENQNIVLKNDLTINNQDEFLKHEIMTPVGPKQLSDYVKLEKSISPNQIDRLNGERYIQVMADIEGSDLGSVNRDVQEVVNKFETEDGYTVTVGGDLEVQQEAFLDILVIFAISIFLVYIVMTIQFNSLRQPFIILTIIPLTVTGVFIGLFISQKEFNLMSALGIIMLVGIVINNGILLIDRAKQKRNQGMDVREAIVEAGKDRIRPILMTTFTTVGGMIPLALATDSASGYQSPLAVVIMSGLLYSILISLIFIPSLYNLMESMGNGVKNLFRKSQDKKKLKSEQKVG